MDYLDEDDDDDDGQDIVLRMGLRSVKSLDDGKRSLGNGPVTGNGKQ